MKTAFIPALIAVLTEACLFKTPDSVHEPVGFWDEDDQVWIRNEDNSCECGQWSSSEGRQPWNVFIYLSRHDGSVQVCTGTIITSNLIVTSHKCLLLKTSRPMNIYDVWKPRAGTRNVAIPSEVSISFRNESEKIPVEDIIYDARYSVRSAVRGFSERDLAILKVSINLLGNVNTTLPICIPPSDFTENVTHQLAEYYHNSVDKQSEIGDDDDDNFHLGVIRPLNVCNTANSQNQTQPDSNNETGTICFQFTGTRGNEIGGGPLIINSTKDTGFLFGIATTFPNGTNQNLREYVFFTNVTSMIKYIEYHALKSGSQWCTTPNLSLNKPVTFINEMSGPYPWELMRMPVARKESLNCVCGILNSEASGRVVGGVTAVPYEFGWQVLLHTFLNGKGSSPFLCGGTIINDLMILTAAHCLVSITKITRGGGEPALKPDEILVYVNIHERKGDPRAISKQVAQVLYHPEHPLARLMGYFDFDVVLKEPITFVQGDKQGLRPVCLPKAPDSFMDLTGKTATVIGWGLTNPEHPMSIASALQKLDVPIAQLTLCSKTATLKVTDRNLCAGTLNKWKDAAGGDSGGPLMIRNEHNQYYEVGITSWGQDVHTNQGEKTAALYSDVQRLLSFIDYHSKRVNANWCKSERTRK